MEGPQTQQGSSHSSLSGMGRDILEHSLLEGASGAVKAIGKRASLWRAGWESWDCPAWKREDPRRFWSIFQQPNGVQGLGTRIWSGRKSGNGFKLGKGRSRWDLGKKLLRRNVGTSQRIPSQPRHREHPKTLQKSGISLNTWRRAESTNKTHGKHNPSHPWLRSPRLRSRIPSSV